MIFCKQEDDKELKKQTDKLFSDLGFHMTTALIVFVKQAVREHTIRSRIRDVAGECSKKRLGRRLVRTERR